MAEFEPPRPALPQPSGVVDAFEICLRFPGWEGMSMGLVLQGLEQGVEAIRNSFEYDELQEGVYPGEIRPIISGTTDYSAVLPLLVSANFCEDEFTDKYNKLFDTAREMQEHYKAVHNAEPSELGGTDTPEQ